MEINVEPIDWAKPICFFNARQGILWKASLIHNNVRLENDESNFYYAVLVLGQDLEGKELGFIRFVDENGAYVQADSTAKLRVVFNLPPQKDAGPIGTNIENLGAF